MNNEEAADALKRLIYPTHAPYHNEVIRLAIAALRTPPATGAAAMRDHVLRLIPEIGTRLIEAGISKGFAMEARGLLLALQVQIMARTEPCNERALPAPEVPQVVKKWARYHDSYSSSRRQWDVDPELRDWIRKEYGL